MLNLCLEQGGKTNPFLDLSRQICFCSLSNLVMKDFGMNCDLDAGRPIAFSGHVFFELVYHL